MHIDETTKETKARACFFLSSSPHVLAPHAPPHLFISANSTGGRFWMTLLLGLLSAMASVPPGRSSRRHSRTWGRRRGQGRESGSAGGYMPAGAEVCVPGMQQVCRRPALPLPCTAFPCLPCQPHQVFDDLRRALVHHKLHRNHVHRRVWQPRGLHVSMHVTDALPLPAGAVSSRSASSRVRLCGRVRTWLVGEGRAVYREAWQRRRRRAGRVAS